MRVCYKNKSDEKVDMFGELEKILKEIKEKKVFNIVYCPEDNVFTVYEKCDDWYEMNLDAKGCRDLSALFSAMADKLEEGSDKHV